MDLGVTLRMGTRGLTALDTFMSRTGTPLFIPFTKRELPLTYDFGKRRNITLMHIGQRLFRYILRQGISALMKT